MLEKKVSIIIPCYNSQEHILECINSVLVQNYSNFEIVIVDDGSKDNTFSICNELANANDNIILMRQENKGVSAARNLGLSVASGDYICFVDSDDFVSKEYVSTLVRELNENNVNAVYMSFSYYFSNAVLERKLRLKDGTYYFSDKESGFIDDGTVSGFLLGSVWSALYKSSLIKKNNICFKEGVSINEDGLFNLQYLRVAESFLIYNYASNYFYRKEWKKYSQPLESVVIKKRAFETMDKVLEICNKETSIDNFENQMRTKKASEYMVLVDELQKCRLSFREFYMSMKSLNGMIIDETWLYDWKNMSRYKRVFLRLSLKKRMLCLSILMRYVYPQIIKYAKR